jgi:puromycin-sensitive aminopeptidase
MKKTNIRLPKEICPLIYDIQLKPDLNNFIFEGIETITLNILKETKIIKLHSREIDVETAEILIKKDKIFAEISYDTDKEFVIFTFPKKIQKGKYKLTIVFKGILNDKMRGFYRSEYVHNGEKKFMATTQFEATDARRAFPCCDEPEQKAIFNVSLIIPKDKNAISNTLPVSIKEHSSDLQIIDFAPSPKMSTYLLAFIVGDFEYIEKISKNGVKVRVYTTPGKKHQANFSLDTAVKVLDFYEEYFDIKYPLNTLDMIAVPDFASGAMENWGAVTYRESALLVDEERSSTTNKQWVALVIAHELAHQWFGNLVTMHWWTDLWLNEGFASYIEYLAVDKLFPTWHIWNQFNVNDLGIALKLDALENTHPIEIHVNHPDEIGEIFDAVSYSKGASIIRMLAEYLGEDKFRDGLRLYLKKHSYKNTKTTDLWEAFEKVSKKDVKKIMQNWTSKAGYPLVSVAKNKDQITLTQERFFSSAKSKKESKENTTWQIPISAKTEKENINLLLNSKKQNIKIKDLSYLKLNDNEISFFRTFYSEELLDKLKIHIEKKELTSANRLGVVRDLFACAEAQIIPLPTVLEFIKSYKDEDDYIVWEEISFGLNKIKQLFSKEKLLKELNKFSIEIFSDIYNKIGWEKKTNEKHTDSMLRSLVISQMGHSGDKNTLEQARKYFTEILAGAKIDPDLKSVIYSLNTFANKKEFSLFADLYKKEDLHEEKNRLGQALANFRDEKVLKKVAIFSFSSSVRKQDSITMLSSVALNPVGRDVVIEFMRENWQEILNRYGDGGHMLTRLVKAFSLTAEEKHFKILKDFFKKNKTPGAERAVKQALEKIENNISWYKKEKQNLEKFLK